jgi:hypothetical protein
MILPLHGRPDLRLTDPPNAVAMEESAKQNQESGRARIASFGTSRQLYRAAIEVVKMSEVDRKI